ncbi:cytochrome C biogenesis protein [Aliidiomarina minuta]|uniref:Cytochrome C biogenesis protein n=1 Tax=Aliidiomarina minuta TaxID=880057 RepID=A0A432W1F1_9GAMM|nr:cytochrome c biogenesis CcdA family protein [Aliidiomarina minuta]RUO23018.1 cytochrome C biogenesis protein [Aliidiomarina minuta]
MELTAIPLALVAGVLSLLSPCVLPMVPAVTASAMRASRSGIWFLGLGLALTFALGGSVLTYLFMSMGTTPDVLRHFAAGLMLVMGFALVNSRLNMLVSTGLSRMISYLPNGGNIQADSSHPAFQFVIGGSLGLIWLPCVGPTLGAAIALASTGEHLTMSFLVMLAFGIGTAAPLIAIGYFAGTKIQALRSSAKVGRLVLGYALLVIALMIFTGFDKVLETIAIEYLPDWVTRI